MTLFDLVWQSIPVLSDLLRRIMRKNTAASKLH